MFMFAIERRGIAVASRQAATETTAASIIAITGTVLRLLKRNIADMALIIKQPFTDGGR